MMYTLAGIVAVLIGYIIWLRCLMAKREEMLQRARDDAAWYCSRVVRVLAAFHGAGADKLARQVAERAGGEQEDKQP